MTADDLTVSADTPTPLPGRGNVPSTVNNDHLDLLLDGVRDHVDQAVSVATADVARLALNAVPCVCLDSYIERGIHNPVCYHHDLADTLYGLADCECERCRRSGEPRVSVPAGTT